MSPEVSRRIDTRPGDIPQIQASSFAIESFENLAVAKDALAERSAFVTTLHDLFRDTLEEYGVDQPEKYRTSSGGQEGTKFVSKKVTPPVRCTLDDGRSLMDVTLGEIIDFNGTVLGYEAQYYSQDSEDVRHSAGIYLRKRENSSGFEVFDGLRLEMNNTQLEGAVLFLSDIQDALREGSNPQE